MIDGIELGVTFRKISQRLSEARVPFHVTGGLAAMYYGEPRFTQDMDLVIRAVNQPDEAHKLIAALAEDFLFEPEFTFKEILRHGLVQVIDKEIFVKVDIHVGESIPGELDRSVLREIAPGIDAPLVSREDAILSKLLWIKKGSHKSRQDVVMMLRRPLPIDWPVLEERAEALGVTDLLAELRAQA